MSSFINIVDRFNVHGHIGELRRTVQIVGLGREARARYLERIDGALLSTLIGSAIMVRKGREAEVMVAAFELGLEVMVTGFDAVGRKMYSYVSPDGDGAAEITYNAIGDISSPSLEAIKAAGAGEVEIEVTVSCENDADYLERAFASMRPGATAPAAPAAPAADPVRHYVCRSVTTGKYHLTNDPNITFCNHSGQSRSAGNRRATAAEVVKAGDHMFCKKCFSAPAVARDMVRAAEVTA